MSADNGSGGRQSFISLTDTGAGINVYTYDVNSDGTFTPDTATSPGILIASGLSYTKWHTTSVEIRFKDGPNNDVVRYFVNGKRVHTGPSWEQYYRNFQPGIHPMGVPVQTLLFRLSAPPFNPPCLACLGGGFYIDKLSLSVSRSGEKGGDGEDDNDHEEHNSYSVALGAGEENQYALAAGPDTISLTAVLADGQGLVMDILNPLGTVVASSLPSVGGATLVVPTVLPGDYTMRVRNIGLTDVTTKLTLIRSITP